MARDKDIEIKSLKNKLNEISEEYFEVKGQIGLLKLENRELEK